MAVRLLCVDNAQGHDGLRWRMGADSQSINIVVGETLPGVGELVVSSPIEPEACFSVAAYAGGQEGSAISVCADTLPSPDLSTAQPGDAVEGGIYVGVITYQDGRSFHIISAAPSDISTFMQWGNANTLTGATSEDDGLLNQEAVLTNHDNGDSFAFYYCRDYESGGFNDFYLPAKNEIGLVYDNLKPTAFSGVTASIWSSTEVSSSNATYKSFNSGAFSSFFPKSNATSVKTLPVRRVPV